jgi:hypothetical protein
MNDRTTAAMMEGGTELGTMDAALRSRAGQNGAPGGLGFRVFGFYLPTTLIPEIRQNRARRVGGGKGAQGGAAWHGGRAAPRLQPAQHNWAGRWPASVG